MVSVIAVKDFKYGYPVTIYAYTSYAKCLRCGREFDNNARVWLVVERARDVGYLVCGECYHEFERKGKFMFSRAGVSMSEVHRVPVTLIKDISAFSSLMKKARDEETLKKVARFGDIVSD